MALTFPLLEYNLPSIDTIVLPSFIILAVPNTFPDIKGILAASYVGLFEMGITFLFWLKAMQKTNSTAKIANLIFISPFISLIFIHFIVGEEIYLSTILGLSIIILGLIFQQLKSSKTNLE